MFINQLRQVIETAPRHRFPELHKQLSAAFLANAISEDDYEQLGTVLALRQQLPPKPRPAPRRVGSRPRTPESIQRRRSWVANGWLPPGKAKMFTPGEQAVMGVIAREILNKGSCTLYNEAIAALAGVCRTVVKRAEREGVRLGLIRVEERRLSGWRNDSNKVTLVCEEWGTWLKIRGATGTHRPREGGGGTFAPTTRTRIYNSSAQKRANMLSGTPAACGDPHSSTSERGRTVAGAAEGRVAGAKAPSGAFSGRGRARESG